MTNNAPKDLDLSACTVSTDGGNTSQKLADVAKSIHDTAGQIAGISGVANDAKKAADDVVDKINASDFLTKAQLMKPFGVPQLDKNNSLTCPGNGGDTWIFTGHVMNENGKAVVNPKNTRVIHQDNVGNNLIVQDMALSYDGKRGCKQFWGGSYNPANLNDSDLGRSDKPWNNLYVSNAPVVTSDINTKTIIASTLSDGGEHQKLLDAIYGVSTKLYQLNMVIQDKGADQARLHSGFIAQELQEALTKNGLDPSKYAFWIQSPAYDSKEVETGEKDASGQAVTRKEYFLKKDKDGNQVYLQSLRYEELFALLAEAFKQKLNHFETELAALKAKVGI